MYCRHCGFELAKGASFCANCASPVEDLTPREGKSRVVAGLLALFLGALGIHWFYLGNKSKGMTQLLVSTVGGVLSCGISTLGVSIWALVEAVQLFSGMIAADGAGVPLRD